MLATVKSQARRWNPGTKSAGFICSFISLRKCRALSSSLVTVSRDNSFMRDDQARPDTARHGAVCRLPHWRGSNAPRSFTSITNVTTIIITKSQDRVIITTIIHKVNDLHNRLHNNVDAKGDDDHHRHHHHHPQQQRSDATTHQRQQCKSKATATTHQRTNAPTHQRTNAPTPRTTNDNRRNGRHAPTASDAQPVQ